MKRLSFILLTIFSAINSIAQDADFLALSDTELQGTARYVGLGGAMAALGGDVSAVKDNPAALGIFRRDEVSFSIDWSSVNSLSDNTFAKKKQFTLPQVSWVLNFGNAQKQKGIIFNNLILQYQRLKTYAQNTQLGMQSTFSQINIMRDAANAQQLLESDMQSPNAWDDINIGWLSLLGYNGYLLNPDTINIGNWEAITYPNERINADLQVYESGSINEYTLGWGCNISNTVYLGLTTNMRTISYQKITEYAEAFEKGGAYNLKTTVTTNGLGFNAALGAIYRPISFLRIGASLQSPTWVSFNRQNYATLYVEGITNEPIQAITTPNNQSYRELALLPMRVVSGISFQVKHIGLISLEYNYTHPMNHYDADGHTLKIGTEWVVNKNWFLRAGYAYQSAFKKEDNLYAWAYNDTRTDTDFRITQATQNIAAGFGFRNKRWIIDLTYQFRLADAHQYMYAEQPIPLDLQTQTHCFVLTFGWTKSK